MKKFLLIICLFCISYGYAQTPIVLDINDLATPIKSFNARYDTAVDASITPGAPGTNLNWNFSALHATYDTLYINVVHPNSVPKHSLFPDANLATVYDSAVNVYFFNRSAAGLVLNGIVNDFLKNGDSIAVALSIPDTALALPGIFGDSAYRYCFGDTKSHCTYTYDTNFSGFPVSVPIDTIRIKHTQYKSDKLDAWGNLTMPNTYQYPALRQKVITYSNDSIWGYAMVPAPYQSYSGWYYMVSQNSTIVTYAWWVKGYGLPAVKMTMLTDTSDVVQNVEWAYDLPPIGSVGENEPLNSSVYPNPANDFITITNASGYKVLVVYDAIGNEISRQAIKSNELVNVSVQDLANGLYFYNLINDGSKASGKFIIKH